MKLDIPATLLKRIIPKQHSSWELWEKKNFNIHRGLVSITPSQCHSIHSLAKEIREGVRVEFHPGWLRGFGFGTIIHFHEVPPDFVEICQHIDTRNKLAGVWQWAVVVLEDDKLAIGIHTWLHGYLRTVYDSVLDQLARDGYQCHASDAEIDILIARLRKIATVGRMLQGLEGIFS